MRRLILAFVVLFVHAGSARAAHYRFVQSVHGPGMGGALAIRGSDLVTTTVKGAALLDGQSGEVLRTFTIPGQALPSTLAVVGGNVAVGVPQFSSSAGGVHLFDGETGALLRTFTNPEPAPGARFGQSLAGLGTQLLVGAPSSGAPGTVRIFDSASGDLLRTLVTPTGKAGDGFGRALAVASDAVLVGAPEDDQVAENAGAAYLFDATTGALRRTFLSPTPGISLGGDFYGASFGASVALREDEIVVAAPYGGVRGWGVLYVLEAASGAIRQTIPSGCPEPPFGDSLLTTADAILITQPDFKGFGRLTVLGTDHKQNLARPIFVEEESGRGFSSALAAAGPLLFVGDPGDPITIYVFADTEHCGDGVVDAGERCDDDNLDDGDGCDSNCRPTGCGNGVQTGSEVCEDANRADGDGCDSNCTPTSCGNGVVTASEKCDDGNFIDGDGCDHNCTPTGCGNQIRTAGEECDDGNRVGGDTCEPDCRRPPLPPECGNAVLDAGEACDDGNRTAGDGCEPDCRPTDPCPSGCEDGDPCTVDTCGITGCAHLGLTGVEGAICVFDNTVACDGQAIPRPIERRLFRARSLLERAQALGSGKAGKPMRKADASLFQMRVIVTQAKRTGRLSEGCANRLHDLITRVRTTIKRLKRQALRRGLAL